MPSKYNILDNISMYEPAQLAEFITNGDVTLEELIDTGSFEAKKRKEVVKMLQNREPNDWNATIKAGTVKALEDFLQRYPNSQMAQQAIAMAAQALHACSDIYALEKFVQEYPTSPRADIAKQRMAALRMSSVAEMDDREWGKVNIYDANSLEKFKAEHPDSAHVRDANKALLDLSRNVGVEAMLVRLNDILTDPTIVDKDDAIFQLIKHRLDNALISKQDILDKIAEDHNLLRSSVLHRLIEEEFIFTYADMEALGIDSRFVAQLANRAPAMRFKAPMPLSRISKLSTEIYFWGIPSSGKSCALGAILSVANSGKVARTMMKDNDCQGYGYMNRLSSLFNTDGRVGVLPEGTAIYSTYEMGFDLQDSEQKWHPFTCIDLAGELVRCMFKSDANELLTEDEAFALQTLTNLLKGNRSRNRKVHFFVIEYGGEERNYEGLRQDKYLEGALQYIRRTKIFKDDTDAIFLMVTKVDKCRLAPGQSLTDHLKEYLSTGRYKGFYKGLKSICEDNEINNGQVAIVPFTVGDVCFQDYCLFDDSAAINVVNDLLTMTAGVRRDRFSSFMNLFKK